MASPPPRRRSKTLQPPFATSSSRGMGGALRGAPSILRSVASRAVALALLHPAAIWFGYRLAAADGVLVATIVLIVVAAINVVFLVDRLSPMRWLAPGLALMILFVLYPVMNTLNIATTNYGNGHLLTKDQALDQLASRFYSSPDAPTYAWRAYRSASGSFLLWLTDKDGNSFIGDPLNGISPVRSDDPRFSPKDVADGLPMAIGEYTKLSRLEVFPYLTELESVGVPANAGVVRIVPLDAAPGSLRKYHFDQSRDVLRDVETGTGSRHLEGTFIAADGTEVTPGFSASVGPRNFVRAFADPEVRGPFISVFVWTVVFALLSVLLTFGAGLGLALVLNDRALPFIGGFRALSIVPYAVPGF